jgi:phosphohistidine swiveling domain-containing protein
VKSLEKWVYLFEEGRDDKSLLGSKGVGLCEMTQAGFPIPPGLIVTIPACISYHANERQFPEGMWDQITRALEEIESKVRKKIGDGENPLLVSVRSGAAIPMPGLMDTVLNVGLNDQSVMGLAKQTGDRRFALDTYRRFVSLFGEIVMGVTREEFEGVMNEYRAKTKGGRDRDLEMEDLRNIIKAEREIVHSEQHAIPNDPYKQLRLCISAAFKAWTGRRAVDYRRINRIPDDRGIAVTVQAMVFGNLDDHSATGVAFTRNPQTGKRELYGEYLINAQGEDVVSGQRVPSPISKLKLELPATFEEIKGITELLEKHYRDMQDFEFTIECGEFWLLQTRSARRSGYAGLQLVLDFLDEHLISEPEAVLRIRPSWLAERFTPKIRVTNAQPIAVGLSASPGAAIGVVALSPESAQRFKQMGKDVIFVCFEGAPDYFDAMVQSDGVVSIRGGMTGHAAVICRGIGKPCVSGLAGMEIIFDEAIVKGGMVEIREGDLITVDGHTGQIFSGALPFDKPGADETVQRIESLLWRVNTSDYIEDGLGLLWQLRDIIRDQGLQHALSTSPSTFKAAARQRPHKFYESFVQPAAAELRNILQALHWNNSEDTHIVAWSILYELQRQLQNEIGIGNHPLAIRPLNDPALSIFDGHSLLLPTELIPGSKNYLYQLIGVEFFGINRFLRYALPWSSVQWWVAVRLDPSLLDAWELDKINPNGESLVARSHELAALLILLDNKPLTVEETRVWYHNLRERELGWSWYRENGLGIREVIDILRDVDRGVTVKEEKILKLRCIGLLSPEMALTPQGLSLIERKNARDRKHLSFQGRVLTDVE